jgi:hypothetical protein
MSDEKCFMWAILSALHPVNRNADRLNNYLPYQYELNFGNLSFPIEVSNIKQFEVLNPTISVNVYTFDEKLKKVLPLRLANEIRTNHIHLLFHQVSIEPAVPQNREDRASVRSHYCWIKNLSRLLRSQATKHAHKMHICDRCLHYFHNEDKLRQHYQICMNQNICAIQMPTDENKMISFKNHHNSLKVPFCIYADLESILKPIATDGGQNTYIYQQHEAFSIGYYFKSDLDDSKSFYKGFRGVDCVKWFCDELYQIYEMIHPIFKKNIPMQLSDEEKSDFQLARICHICSSPFSDKEVKVRDHNHLTGAYRGAAHQKCNLKFQESRSVPVVFHNLSGYDSHFIIRKIMNAFEGDVHVIPCTDQHYISFTTTVADSIEYDPNFEKQSRNTVKFKFLDSYRFMASSLDKLASYLPSACKTILHREFVAAQYRDKVHLLEKKGIFPYDFITSWEKLNCTQLPEKNDFYSKLTESHITDDEYKFALDVWNAFNVKTMGEYADLYLKTDILLLADVFENFRNSCLDVYGLDPAHYFTLPGYSFDAMLRYTRVNIELLTDIDMVMFVENGIRGGISQCTKRYAKANNKYMPDYDETKASSYLMYLDQNSLYAWAMKNSLPLNDFRWCSSNMTVDSILEMVKDQAVGCLIEVDIEYDRSLHDKHSDYPMCAERMCPPNGKCKKLLLTLHDKKKYVIHHRMLAFVLRHGLKITKVHRVLRFRQCAWLKTFIDLNTVQRTNAKNDFEKNLYKLMSNAIYGKTMENIRNRREIKLKTKWDGRYGVKNLIAAPNFKRRTIFDDELVAVEMSKMEMLMNKPIIIGMAVLEISKLLMYEFHYDFMKPKFDHQPGLNNEPVRKCEIMYTDTDSFVYEFTNVDDIYEEMKKDIHMHYDTSDYPQPNIYNMPSVNKKKPGLMKDENNGCIMTEFVGLRSKVYYYKCITENCTISKPQNTIRSFKHNVVSMIQTKIALSPFDDKRFICTNKIDTLPWGHYKINI